MRLNAGASINNQTRIYDRIYVDCIVGKEDKNGVDDEMSIMAIAVDA